MLINSCGACVTNMEGKDVVLVTDVALGLVFAFDFATRELWRQSRADLGLKEPLQIASDGKLVLVIVGLDIFILSASLDLVLQKVSPVTTNF